MRKYIVLLLVFIFVFQEVAFAMQISEALAIKIILGEARDDRNRDYAVWLGIAEVIRRRNDVSEKSFCALRDRKLDSKLQKDRTYLLKLKKMDIVEQARKAWRQSKHTNITKGATHFENVRAFGEPPWSKTKTKTIKIKDITFYR